MGLNAIASFRSKARHGLGLAARDLASRRRPAPVPAEASADDLYLAPHYDDICFSLGAFVSRRRRGTLLTLFSRSAYVARPQAIAAEGEARIAAISGLRQREDAAFAQAVGLRLALGGLDEAPLRGRGPFETARAEEDAERLDGAVMAAILTAAGEPREGPRPWLFCPIGIGGHIDHVALLRIVLKHAAALRARWRLAFYEDLHYASDWQARVAGIRRLRDLAAPLRLRRSSWPTEDAAAKLALVCHYRSQFETLPTTATAFTPAQCFPAAAHEALWSEQAP